MKKLKPNIIDVVIIAAIILILITAIFRIININHLPDMVKDQKVAYTFVIYDEDEAYKNAIKPGDNLYLYPKNAYCGKVTNVESQYAKENVIYPDGTAKSHVNPSKINIILTVEISADMTENGFYIADNTFLTRGFVSDINTTNIVFNGQITEIHSDVN